MKDTSPRWAIDAYERTQTPTFRDPADRMEHDVAQARASVAFALRAKIKRRLERVA